jgi:hypothetical protein
MKIETIAGRVIVAFLVGTIAQALIILAAIRLMHAAFLVPVSFVLTFGICMWPAAALVRERRWLAAVVVGAAGFGAGWAALLVGTLIAGMLMGGTGAFP